MNLMKMIRVRRQKSTISRHYFVPLLNDKNIMIYVIDLKQQLKLPEDSMFSGFTPIIGYELKPIFIKTTSDRVSIIFKLAGCCVVSDKLLSEFIIISVGVENFQLQYFF